MAEDVQRLGNGLVRLQLSDRGGVLAFIKVCSSLIHQICEGKFKDEKLCIIQDKVARGETREAILNSGGFLRIRSHICEPNMVDLIRLILEEAHCIRYSIHPGAAKIYHDLSRHYWWCSIKKDITKFVFKCLTC